MSRRHEVILAGLSAFCLALLSLALVYLPNQRFVVIFVVILVVVVAMYHAFHAHQSSPSADKNSSERNRRQMLKKVRHDWIQGVLEQSLYHVARIELELETKPEAASSLWKSVVQRPVQDPQLLPPGTSISQVFEGENQQSLLILGEPGTGKSTSLLELARDLLDRAEKDTFDYIPVVFNLSSWAVQRRPLADWLVEELRERYDIIP